MSFIATSAVYLDCYLLAQLLLKRGDHTWNQLLHQGEEFPQHFWLKVGGRHVWNKGGAIYIKNMICVICHTVLLAWVAEDWRLSKCCIECSVQMQRGYATTGFMLDVSSVIQEMVGVFVSWRTRVASSRMELVSVPQGFLSNINAATMWGGHVWYHMMIDLDLDGSSHTPPAPMLEAFQNPRWVGSQRKISTRWVVWVTICVARAFHTSTYLRNSRKSQSLYSSSYANGLCIW